NGFQFYGATTDHRAEATVLMRGWCRFKPTSPLSILRFTVKLISGIKKIPFPLKQRQQTISSPKKHPQRTIGMGKSRLIGELRKKAIQTLRESTDTLEQASIRRDSGDLEEAEKAHELARSKRAEAVR